MGIQGRLCLVTTSRRDSAGVETARNNVFERFREQITSHPVAAVAVVALLARLALITYLQSRPGTFAQDDSTYRMLAEARADGDLSTWSAYEFQLWQATLTFLWPLSKLFQIFGPSQLVGQLFVAAWGIAVPTMVTILALRFLYAGIALGVGVVLAVLPSQALWSSLILKDPLVWASLALIALACALASSSPPRRLWMWLSIVGIGLLSLAYLRDHTLVVAGIAVLLAAFFGRTDTRAIRTIASAGLMLAVPFASGLGPGGFSLIADPDLASRRLANAQGARSAYISSHPESEATPPIVASDELENIKALVASIQQELADLNAQKEGTQDPQAIARLEREIERKEMELAELEGKSKAGPPTSDAAPPIDDTPAANLANLPRGLSVMLLEPLPWRDPTSANMNLARWENLIWYPLLLLAAVGLWPSRKHLSVMAFPLFAGGGMLLVYALAEGNIGTAFRHRGEFVWVVALLAGVGLKQVRDWRVSRAS